MRPQLTVRIFSRGAVLAGLLLWSFGAQGADRFFRKTQFLRGDANADGNVDVADPLFVLRGLFSTGPAGTCLEAQDANDDGSVDVADPLFTLFYLFSGAEAPPAPGPEECGVVVSGTDLGCDAYGPCPDDTLLITHVLSRITFGPNEELLTTIQTKADLARYIESQLSPPENYDPAVHEPELWRRVEGLGIGFDSYATATNQVERLKGLLIENSLASEWQLLHVLAQFWNNHFHTQVEVLRNLFFRRDRRGGNAGRGDAGLFAAVDADGTGEIDAAEWGAFRRAHPGLRPFDNFGRRVRDGVLTEDDVIGTAVADWKYAGRNQQLGVASEMERREYELFRRLGFGRFRELLAASAKSVAMVIYLNGFENTADEPNENYAREIMELSSLGVDRVYTQRDIEELARVLTGWSAAWVRRSDFDPLDLHFQGNPGARSFPIDLREPQPYRFPTTRYWDDEVYTWAFAFGSQRNAQTVRRDGHDWGRKDLFLDRYGGVDSLGNPVDPGAALTIPANGGNRTVGPALEELDLVLDRLASFRDSAKFVSTKLIQLFVTDDLSLLAKTYPIPDDLGDAFDAVDLDESGTIDITEWEEPVPLVLPNGRPMGVFTSLDADGDGSITRLEYQEPDLLLDAIAAWQTSGGSIREVVRTILFSPEFLSLKFYRAKVKTPYETFVSAIRSLDATLSAQQRLQTTRDLTLAGMELFDFGDPTGESELGFDWMHTIGLLERLKYLNRGANPAVNRDQRFTWNTFNFTGRWRFKTRAAAVDFFSLLLLGGDVLDEQRQLAIQAFADNPREPLRGTVGFLLSLPQFQKQ